MEIVSQAPCRVSLFGGGTDLPEFSSKYGGFCLNMAINIRQKMEIECDTTEDQFGNLTFPVGGNERFYKTIMNEMGVSEREMGIEAVFDGELTGGLGSSAAAAVCLVGTINKYKSLGMSRAGIAERAWEIEVNRLGLYGGRQDQNCAAFGGVNGMEFRGDRVTVLPLDRRFVEELYPSLVLFHLGFNRKDPKIQEGFKNLTQEQVFYLTQIKELVIEATLYIGEGDIEAVGKLLDKSWELKKKSNKGVGNNRFEEVLKRAKDLGVWGGKICGAGSGGYCIFMIDPDKRQKLIDELGIKWVDFDIDWQGLDCRIL